jgi:hypothetical protein
MLSGRHDGWLVGFFFFPNLFLFTAVWRVDETGCCFFSLDFMARQGMVLDLARCDGWKDERGNKAFTAVRANSN